MHFSSLFFSTKSVTHKQIRISNYAILFFLSRNDNSFRIKTHFFEYFISIANNSILVFYFIDHLKNNFNFSYRKRLKLPCHLTEYEPSSPIHNSNFTANEKKKKKRGEQKNKTTIINLQFCGTVFVSATIYKKWYIHKRSETAPKSYFNCVRNRNDALTKRTNQSNK